MKIEVPISLGELMDKISILLIKKDKIADKEKQDLILVLQQLISKLK